MNRKYYLIDTENAGDRWIEKIEHLQEGDILVVFYTNYHSKLLEETYLKQRYNKQIRWVECIAGINALDYQLIGVLSYLIATDSDAEYAICSNDRDYQEAVDFCKQRSISISRIGFPNNSAKKNTIKSVPVNTQVQKPTRPQQKLIPLYSGKTLVDIPKMYKLPTHQKLKEIAKAIPISNMGGWYTALVTLLGQEDGKKCYAQIKESDMLRKELSKYIKPSVKSRNIYLVALLFSQNNMDVAKAETAYKIVSAKNNKNLNAIKRDFDKHFGNKTEEQLEYYRTIKPIISLLKNNR